MPSFHKPKLLSQATRLGAVSRLLGTAVALNPALHHASRLSHPVHETKIVSRNLRFNKGRNGRLIKGEATGLLRTNQVAKIEGDHVVTCTRLDGPSRYERRRAYKNSLHSEILSAGRRHLGTFDGERKRLSSAAVDPGETLGRDLASLAWLCAFLTVIAFIVGAL